MYNVEKITTLRENSSLKIKSFNFQYKNFKIGRLANSKFKQLDSKFSIKIKYFFLNY